MTDQKEKLLERWEAEKRATIAKWKCSDEYFRCTACGRIVDMVRRGKGYTPSVLLPVNILMMSTTVYGTCLCYDCYLKKRSGEYLEEQDLQDNGEAEPIVDYSLEPHGWGTQLGAIE